MAAKAKAREARLNRIIEREKVEKPRELEIMRLSISGRIHHRSPIVRLENISYSVDAAQILENISVELIGSTRVILTGENGSGKTTLLKLINSCEQSQQGCGLYKRTALRLAICHSIRSRCPIKRQLLNSCKTVNLGK